MKKNDLLCLMLRSALWSPPLKFQKMPSEAYRALMNTAEKQTVTGLFCHTLIANNVKLIKYDAVESLAQLQHIEERNKQVNKALVDLCTLLNRHDIKFIVVKGQTLASLYPTPTARIPGDIDFYCDAENFDKAKKVIEESWNVSFKYDAKDVKQHMSFEYGSIDFEQHLMLCNFSSPSIQKQFDQYINEAKTVYATVEGTAVPTLEPTINVLYTFLHLYRHLIELGCSLRQFCDLAILLHHFKNQIDRPKLSLMLKQIQHEKAFCAIGTILVDCLGLPEDEFPFELTKTHRSYKEELLKIIFTRGNFGKYGRKHAVRSGIGYYMETFALKIRHQVRFFRLAPKENLATLTRGLPQKIFAAIKRH